MLVTASNWTFAGAWRLFHCSQRAGGALLSCKHPSLGGGGSAFLFLSTESGSEQLLLIDAIFLSRQVQGGDKAAGKQDCYVMCDSW